MTAAGRAVQQQSIDLQAANAFVECAFVPSFWSSAAPMKDTAGQALMIALSTPYLTPERTLPAMVAVTPRPSQQCSRPGAPRLPRARAAAGDWPRR